jgi:hypothetical protein
MYRGIRLVAVALLVACADARVGMQRIPIGGIDSDEAILGAIRQALPPDEQTCRLELVTAGNAQEFSESTDKQIAAVKICGRSQEFSIQRSRINADSVLIVAKKI